jgi:hypothetical protein
MNLSIFTTIVTFLLLCCVVATTRILAQNIKLFHLSDFHYDPFYGTSCAMCTAGQSPSAQKSGYPGCDSSAEMVKGTLRAVARTIVDLNVDEAIIVYTGDWFRHGMRDQCLLNHGQGSSAAVGKEIMDFIFQAFEDDLYNYTAQYEASRRLAGFPSRKNRGRRFHVLPVGHHNVGGSASQRSSGRTILKPVTNIGNEDGGGDALDLQGLDYYFNVTAPPLPMRDFANKLQSKNYLQPNEAQMYAKCGYTSTEIMDGKIRVIVLNTLLWAIQLKPKPTSSEMQDPCGQLAWLKQEMNTARSNGGQKIYIQSHIPPLFGFWNFLEASYFSTFANLLEENNDLVSGIFFGHIHRFQYGVISSPTNGARNIVPFWLGGPVTRASKTIPDFGVYDIDPTNFTITDVRQNSITSNATDPLQPSSWSLGTSFKTAMGLSDLSSNSLYNLAQNFRRNSSYNNVFQTYLAFEQGGYIPDGVTCTGSCQNIAACELISFTVGEDALCNL